MKWLTGLATLVLACSAIIWPARADDKAAGKEGVQEKAVAKKGVEGKWEGRVNVTPQIGLRITLDVTKAKDGSLSGKWGSPDQGQKDLPLESIAFKDGVLTFSAKAAGATYKGKLE